MENGSLMKVESIAEGCVFEWLKTGLLYLTNKCTLSGRFTQPPVA